MKVLLFYIIFTIAYIAIQAQKVSKCQMVLDYFQEQGQMIIDSYKEKQYHKTTVYSIVLQQFLKTVEQECPVITQKEYDIYKAPFDCQKTVYKLEELFQGDVVSNYSNIVHIIKFQGQQCLPYHFQQGGLQDVMKKIEQNIILEGNKNKQQNSNKYGCAACGFGITLLSNYIEVHGLDISKFINDKVLCRFLPGKFKVACEDILDLVGPMLIQMLLDKQNSDVICSTLGACNGWEQCKLHGTSSNNSKQQYVLQDFSYEQQYLVKNVLESIMPVQWIQELMSQGRKGADGAKHLPRFDLDGDRYSDVATMRGYDWRGKDCNDLSKKIHPGRKKPVGLKGTDYNCNGIHGYDRETGAPYKDKFCMGSGQMGMVDFGDSVGAHFSLPPQWLNVSEWHNGAFQGFIPKLLNELDLPQLSGATGWQEGTYNSFYLQMLERNRCNKNDYQNLAVNGASSRDSFDNILALARDQQNDYPLMIFWELVGNDVCGETPEEMTTPEQFRENILKLWGQIDKMVPKGSHMIVTGVVDGRVLYECLKDREQPMGIPYPVFYDYLACLEVTPCAGWLNSNSTIRNQTSERAAQLNQVYKELIASQTYKNFDIQYYDMPIKEVFEEVYKEGHQCWEVIEPSDGFHPNGIAEGMWAKIIWDKVAKDKPSWLGDQNPHNQEIIDKFGKGPGYTFNQNNEIISDEQENEAIELL